MNINWANHWRILRPYVWAAIGYLTLTGLLMWPICTGLWESLPDRGDSFHNIWTWGDNINRIKEGRNIFDANILFPNRSAGLFQELQALNTILFATIYLPSGNPVLAYNIILLASFFLTALLTYSIAFRLGNHSGLAFLAGIATAFFPFRFAHLPHVQLLTFFWVLLPFFLLILYLQRPQRWLLVAFFISYTLQIIGVGYNTIFLIIIAWGYLLVHLVLSNESQPLAGHRMTALISLVVAFLFALPAYIPYLHTAKEGYLRGIEELKWYGLDLALLSSVPGTNYLYGSITSNLRAFRPDGVISSVFPGVAFAALAAIAILRVWRKKLWQRGCHRKDIVFFASAATLFFCVALGPIIKLRGEDVLLNPLFLLFKFVPVFSATRYLPAYIQPAIFAISVLIVIVLANTRFFQKKLFSTVTVIFLAVLMFAEYRTGFVLSAPILYGTKIPPVYQWLKDQPRLPLIELPIPDRADAKADHFLDQFKYMYYSIYHGQRMVNGITGFFPEETLAMMRAGQTFPSRGFIRKMRDVGVAYIVVHYDKYQGLQLPDEIVSAFPDLNVLYRDESSVVFFINPEKQSKPDLPYSSAPDQLSYQILDVKAPLKVALGSAIDISLRVRNSGNTIWLSDTWNATPRAWRGATRHARMGSSRWEK